MISIFVGTRLALSAIGINRRKIQTFHYKMNHINKKYPQRKRTRLKEYDYSTNAYYFITICVNHWTSVFGSIHSESMTLNSYGKIIVKHLLSLNERFKSVEIDYYVIMPNHIHFILILDSEENGTSISNIIGSFKSLTTVELHKSGLKEFKWQRSFYDSIIRNESELYNIRNYIDLNPLKWELEKNNPENLDL